MNKQHLLVLYDGGSPTPVDRAFGTETADFALKLNLVSERKRFAFVFFFGKEQFFSGFYDTRRPRRYQLDTLAMAQYHGRMHGDYAHCPVTRFFGVTFHCDDQDPQWFGPHVSGEDRTRIFLPIVFAVCARYISVCKHAEKRGGRGRSEEREAVWTGQSRVS